MTVNEAFAKNVTNILSEYNWTQLYLSEASGISKHTINGILRGHQGPSLYTAFLIADALEVSLDELTEGADE